MDFTETIEACDLKVGRRRQLGQNAINQGQGLFLIWAQGLSPVYTFTIFSTIHHDSSRFLMVRKIGVDRDESWRKVEIFSVTTIPVRMSTI